jgi:hypothetical protein
VVCRESPGGESLFFASPKKSNQKKGDPQSGPLRGSLKKLNEPENLETSLLRSRRTSRFFNPSPPAFSSPARTGLEEKDKCKVACKRFALACSPNPNRFPQPVLAEPSSADGGGTSGQTCLRRSRVVWTAAGIEQRRLPVAKRRDSDCGSPFLLLTLLLAKQKKSELPPGNPRQLREGTKRYQLRSCLRPYLLA